jgi:hypothetical protein
MSGIAVGNFESRRQDGLVATAKIAWHLFKFTNTNITTLTVS